MAETDKNSSGLQRETTSEVYVAGIGMITPVGATSAMTFAATRAGISGYRLSDRVSLDGEQISIASVPDTVFSDSLIEIAEGRYYNAQFDRIIKMTIIALGEAVSTISSAQPIPLVLAMAERVPDERQLPLALLVDNVVGQGTMPFDAKLAQGVYTGRAAGIHALDAAMDYLAKEEVTHVLVGGGDSYHHSQRIDRLDAAGRLSTPTRGDGFVPGEGAGFVLLSQDPEQAVMRNGWVVKLGRRQLSGEPGHLHTDAAYLGEGLDRAFKGALAGSAENSVDVVYSSMNGEHYWAKEYGVAITRSKRYFRDDFDVEHPADCYGDLGAATTSVLIGLAAEALLRREDGGTALVYGSSDYESRAALCLETVRLAL